MATIVEREAARVLSLDRAERVFKIEDAASDTEALELALLTAPAAVNVYGVTIPVKTKEITVEEKLSGKLYEVIVPYSRGGSTEDDLEVGDVRINYDFGTSSFNRKISLSTRDKATAAGFNEIDFNQQINVTTDSVDGVDYEVPTAQMNITTKFSASQVNDSYLGTVAQLVGSVNNAYFRGLQSGEGLLMSANLDPESDGTWIGTFAVAISPNETGLAVGNGLTVDKEGWDYVWLFYATEANNAGPLPTPRQANVERIYRRGNWGALKIG